MKNNYRIEYAQNELNRAQAIEDYVRKGIAKDLDGVIDDLTNIDENGNEMTPTSVCIDSLTFYLGLLQDVSGNTAYRKERLDEIVKEEQGTDGDENEQH